MKRRDFLKGALAGAGLAATGMIPSKSKAAPSNRSGNTFGNRKQGVDFYKIDAFGHFVPDAYSAWLSSNGLPNSLAAYAAAIPEHHDPVARIKMMDDEEIAVSIIFPQPDLESLGAAYPTYATQAAYQINKAMSDICVAYPDSFKFAALLPLNEDIDTAFGEAAGMPGMVGIGLNTGPLATPPDDAFHKHVYEIAAAHDIPVWIHFNRGANVPDFKGPVEFISYDFIWVNFGFLLDGSAAMMRIVIADVFKNYNGIKIIVHQRGNLIPLFKDRIRMHFEAFQDIFPPPVGMPPNFDIDYTMSQFQNFYVDAICSGEDADLLARSVNYFGADKVMYATDAAYSPRGGRYVAEMSRNSVLGLQVTNKDMQNIFANNIRNLIPEDIWNR
jgi:predicted TIM-barrel fold metal-dependent hydrolase